MNVFSKSRLVRLAVCLAVLVWLAAYGFAAGRVRKLRTAPLPARSVGWQSSAWPHFPARPVGRQSCAWPQLSRPIPWDGKVAHGPTFPPDPWDGKVAHGPSFPPDPWDGKVAHGPSFPPDPWDGKTVEQRRHVIAGERKGLPAEGNAASPSV
jgi:hypothetical protein